MPKNMVGCVFLGVLGGFLQKSREKQQEEGGRKGEQSLAVLGNTWTMISVGLSTSKTPDHHLPVPIQGNL